MLVLGGDEGGTGDQLSPRNDVWRSSDGKTWVRQSATSPWAARKFFGAAMDNDDRTSLVVCVAVARAASMIDLRGFGSQLARCSFSGPGVDATPLVWSECVCFLAGYDGFAHHDVWLGDAEGIGSWFASHVTEKAATTSLRTPVAASESMAASWRRRVWKVFSAEMRGNFRLQRLPQMTGGRSEVGMRGLMCAPSLQSGFNQVRRHGLHELDMWRWWIQKVTLSSSSVERDLQASWQTCGRPSALTWSICTTCWS